MDAGETRAVELLRELVPIDSVSSRSNRPIVERVVAPLARKGFRLREHRYLDDAGVEKSNLVASAGPPADPIGAGGLVRRRFGRDERSAAVASVTAGSITAGTNDGTASSIDAARLRASLRQVKTCCGRRPCRRATSDTTAPGISVSATILALSSSVQRRRPPTPLITSKR